MFRAAISFFIIGLIAFALGLGNIGGLSMEVGKTILYVFLTLAVLSYIISYFGDKKRNQIKLPNINL
jgi:uncharacterized membrane protein YtjA (UPF0391 family)